ncbi:sigma 54-interacting transcriptional regulator [Neobacillus cucumis]|uniref:sigma-54 interaction domain-containing protein n=1 Tax=Neobacillus cucumis TaxID=1740721 RepID=UPI0018DFAE8C|nr:sigma 54-interacting transcriptional regulator [Neobacillus cucumis]MBI0579385.1 sigma 54-interacting transcriptional regulator [Neobacillus cucumis]WHY92878.1 sigma 54-interacting transcriptional regulator [Neobacillus cucumis]
MSIAEIILETLVKTSNNNITITDEKGVILYTNSEHWTVYEDGPKEYIGKSIFELQELGILTPSITAKVLTEQKPIQIMQNTKKGKIIMSTAYPIYNDKGEIIRVISYALDRTEISSLQAQYEQLERKLKEYQIEMEELKGREDILYRSKEMQQIAKTIQRVAPTDATVLMLGESGVGKSMLARKLHTYSNRHKKPFIEVNCTTIPASLFESEMFGYESGSFTGAQKNGKPGLIEQAHEGTLFLDEIGELPLSIQAKLLKVLQEKKFIRVGGTKERHVDFRLVTATNKNLEEMVQKGEFRLDLFYRLHVIPLSIPALRDRKEDISLLINHYIELMNKKYKTAKKLHPSVFEKLLNYKWPGNVRELENLLERLVLTTEEPIIRQHSLPTSILGEGSTHEEDISLIENLITEETNLKTVLDLVEKWMLEKAQKQCKSTYEIAKYLGISQPSVIRKLKKHKEELDNFQ